MRLFDSWTKRNEVKPLEDCLPREVIDKYRDYVKYAREEAEKGHQLEPGVWPSEPASKHKQHFWFDFISCTGRTHHSSRNRELTTIS